MSEITISQLHEILCSEIEELEESIKEDIKMFQASILKKICDIKSVVNSLSIEHSRASDKFTPVSSIPKKQVHLPRKNLNIYFGLFLYYCHKFKTKKFSFYWKSVIHSNQSYLKKT